MKKILLLSFSSFIVWGANAQGTVTLDTNQVKVAVPSTPQLFWGGGMNPSVFEVPKGSGKSTIFTATPWIWAKKDTQSFLAAEAYRQTGTDYQSGPVSTAYSFPASDFDVVKLSKGLVEQFKSDSNMWANPPVEISRWPAHGDVSNGQAAKLAPFVNVGGDPEKYEPAFGDYPLIKGDQCAYYIFNDDKTHTESGGRHLKAEMHRMVYEYADTHSFIKHAVFVDYQVFNRSAINYDSIIFSIYTDYDLGKFDDDFIGTDSANAMVYAYNGSNTDAQYGANPPAQGMVLLSNHPFSSIFYNNDNTAQGNPVNAADYRNYMHHTWINGSPLTYGGNGYGGTVPSSYAFSGDPCDSTGWTEANASRTPGDRRLLVNLAIPQWNAGESFTVSMAYLYARGDNGASGSICKLQSEAALLKTWSLPTGMNEKMVKDIISAVYPNPSQTGFTLELTEKADLIEVTDLTGKVVGTYEQTIGKVKIDPLTPGMYLIKVSSADGFFTRKVIAH